MCTRCILPGSFPRISFDATGVCSVCRSYDQLWGDWNSRKTEQRKILDKLCKEAKAKHKEFDALIPLSGGKDSMYVLYVAARQLGLNCLAYTLDTGYLSECAKQNIDVGCRKLGIKHIYYCLDPELTNQLFSLFIRKTGRFCTICLKGIQMSQAFVAEAHKVPLIITGTSLRTELPLSREMFQAGEPTHIRNVLAGEPIAAKCKNYCTSGLSIQRKIGNLLFLAAKNRRLITYARFNLADYIEWD